MAVRHDPSDSVLSLIDRRDPLFACTRCTSGLRCLRLSGRRAEGREQRLPAMNSRLSTVIAGREALALECDR
jgi:hypothetical protein